MKWTLQRPGTVLRSVLFWGLAWGAFEATIGFVLHQLPFAIGAYVWFPAAYFFMDRTYQKTGRRCAVVWTALLSASLKMLNLFWAIRSDYVINPAVSIVLESLAMVGVLSFTREGKTSFWQIAWKVSATNALWRLGYTLYAAALVPAWMREVSVVRDAGALLSFVGHEHVLSSLACVGVMMVFQRRTKRAPAPRVNPASHHSQYSETHKESS